MKRKADPLCWRGERCGQHVNCEEFIAGHAHKSIVSKFFRFTFFAVSLAISKSRRSMLLDSKHLDKGSRTPLRVTALSFHIPIAANRQVQVFQRVQLPHAEKRDCENRELESGTARSW